MTQSEYLLSVPCEAPGGRTLTTGLEYLASFVHPHLRVVRRPLRAFISTCQYKDPYSRRRFAGPCSSIVDTIITHRRHLTRTNIQLRFRVRPFVLLQAVPGFAVCRPCASWDDEGYSWGLLGASEGYMSLGALPHTLGSHHSRSPLPLRPTPTMIPIYLSLVVLSCLSFAGAEPFHIPLVRRRDPISVEEWGIAADALRNKYGYPHSSPSKRQDTAAIPIINQVRPPFSP